MAKVSRGKVCLSFCLQLLRSARVSPPCLCTPKSDLRRLSLKQSPSGTGGGGHSLAHFSTFSPSQGARSNGARLQPAAPRIETFPFSPRELQHRPSARCPCLQRAATSPVSPGLRSARGQTLLIRGFHCGRRRAISINRPTITRRVGSVRRTIGGRKARKEDNRSLANRRPHATPPARSPFLSPFFLALRACLFSSY